MVTESVDSDLKMKPHSQKSVLHTAVLTSQWQTHSSDQCYPPEENSVPTIIAMLQLFSYTIPSSTNSTPQVNASI